MGYVELTEEMEIMWTKVKRFFAKNAKEDRGDGFREGTPDEIVEMYDKIHQYINDHDDGHM